MNRQLYTLLLALHISIFRGQTLGDTIYWTQVAFPLPQYPQLNRGIESTQALRGNWAAATLFAVYPKFTKRSSQAEVTCRKLCLSPEAPSIRILRYCSSTHRWHILGSQCMVQTKINSYKFSLMISKYE